MPLQHRRKLALVFTGAVSLGSFEAGVAYEILKHINEGGNPGLEVDVIVGTSAGALTGALAALCLVWGISPEIMEEAWLSVKLEDLLRLNRGDRSVLSSSKVEDLIKKYISPPPASLIKEKAPNRTVNFVAVVTNLDGIKYRIHKACGKEFSIGAIGYEDAMKFRIDRTFTDWERLRMAVRASSAFPAALEPKTVYRSNEEFRALVRYNFSGKDQKEFHYSDGGIVNNQPLNRAIEVVNDLPETGSAGTHERVFLVVDPSPPMGSSPRDEYGVFDVLSKAVWTIPRNQTLYKDLLLLEKVNRRIQWKNAYVSLLADIWNTCDIPPEKSRKLDSLCREVALFKGSRILEIDQADYLRAEEKRIRDAYKKEINKVRDKDFFTKYCYLLEQVADLRNKHEIAVEMITPQDADRELAGVIFGNFGGFLDSEFMKHDFNVGRIYAGRWLKKERELNRLVLCRHQGVSPKINRRVFQMMFDNTIPLIVEDIGPRLFAGGTEEGLGPGKLTLLGMFAVSMARYLVKKTVSMGCFLFSRGVR
ncbi:MAG: hypothetical protein CVU89_02095 [Firmicutes bacterium HGW-Firmicutes-14]|nr:MAG: hypothetical protein CVU89_02095 [Firmicutes bacterium HGW-Firmicutes-14]